MNTIKSTTEPEIHSPSQWAVAEPSRRSGKLLFLLSRLKSYFQLTKPTIMLLVLFTGATALVVEGSMLTRPGKGLLFLLGLYLTGGSANSFNQYFEREIDARMTRTRRRRPLPLGQISPAAGLLFSIIIGLAGVLLLGFFFNRLTAIISMATILFYSLFYTLFLKPRSSQNIVIGGIAGAMAPIGAWTAATGGLALMPIFLFLIVFLWTPPHFWSLALCYQDDYRAAGYPMLPLVKGKEGAIKQITYYSMALVLASFLPLLAGAGWFYLISAAITGIIFSGKIIRARREMSLGSFWGIFKHSIIYLFALFLAVATDRFL